MRHLKGMRPRTSTIVLTVLFLAVLAMYFLVRPVPVPPVAAQPAPSPVARPGGRSSARPSGWRPAVPQRARDGLRAGVRSAS